MCVVCVYASVCGELLVSRNGPSGSFIFFITSYIYILQGVIRTHKKYTHREGNALNLNGSEILVLFFFGFYFFGKKITKSN